MNLPPLLMGATLLFWSWQVDLFHVGAILAIVFEGTRLTRFRWQSTEDELNRLWNLVTLVFLAAAVFAFTSNDGPLAFSQMFDNPGFNTSRLAGESSQKTAASLIQWMPIIFFPFLLAVALSRQNTVRLKVLSLIARRQKTVRELPALANYEIHIGWVYFAVCLVSSSINSRNDRSFFAGLSALVIWALWTRRSRRFALPLWAVTAAAACLLAYWGQNRLGELRLFVENFTPQWNWRTGGRKGNPDESRTAIGQIGRIKGSGKIVVRMQPKYGTPAPTLLRTASYRFYRSPIWASGNPREEAGYPGSFDTLTSPLHSSLWTLRSSGATNEVQISSYLEDGVDLLPLPLGTARLENLSAFNVRTNNLGTVIVEGPGVVLFDAVFGSDGSIDGAPQEFDRFVPSRELEAIEQVISEMCLEEKGTNTQAKLRAVSAFFQDNFEYSLWLRGGFNRNEIPTPLTRFLLETRAGHCEYFATATVLLLRELDIPARYAVGWAVEEASGSGYVVRERHAHAWCLYYDQADGQWHDFDTTPASWVEAENDRASMFEFLSDFWGRIKFELAKIRWGQSNLRQYVGWIIGPMLVFLLYRLLRRKPGDRPSGENARADRQPARFGLDSEFYLVERELAQVGFIRAVGETQRQFMERAVRDARVAALKDSLPALLRAHYRLRFDPLGLTSEEREALKLRVHEAIERLGRARKTG